MRREHDEATARLVVASEELTAHEAALAELSARADSVQHTWFGLSALAERMAATVRIASERTHHLDAEPVAVSDTDPEALEAEAEKVALDEQRLLAELGTARSWLEAARADLADRERQAADADKAHLAAVRAEADRREGLARLAGRVETMRARVESIDDSVARLSERIEEAAARVQQTRAEFETVQGRVGELDQGEVGLDEHHERTVAALRLADERVAELQAAERGAERQVASLQSAHRCACRWGSSARTARRGSRRTTVAQGFSGPIAKLVKVRSGYEAALAAVLGPAADALAAEELRRGPHRGRRTQARPTAAARRWFWATGRPQKTRKPRKPGKRPAGRAAQRCAVGARPGRGAAAAARRDDRHARRTSRWSTTWAKRWIWCALRPQLRAVTIDGDLVGAGWVSGGSDRKLSTLEVASEIDKAGTELAAAETLAAQTDRGAVRRADRAVAPVRTPPSMRWPR